MLFDRIEQTMQELGIPDAPEERKRAMQGLFRLVMDLYPERMQLMEMRVGKSNAELALQTMKKRNDKLRDVIESWLSGDLSGKQARRRISRVFYDTDYSTSYME